MQLNYYAVNIVNTATKFLYSQQLLCSLRHKQRVQQSYLIKKGCRNWIKCILVFYSYCTSDYVCIWDSGEQSSAASETPNSSYCEFSDEIIQSVICLRILMIINIL